MQTKINKAVFSLTGTGASALRTAGSANLPSIVDKPLLRYGIGEALAASVDDMIFVVERKESNLQAIISSQLPAGVSQRFIFTDAVRAADAALTTLPFIPPAPALQLAAVTPQANEANALAG
jgi:dTDP-glucose pyrophosphorylase